MVKASLFTLIVMLVAFGTIAIAKTVMTNSGPVIKTQTTTTWYFQDGDPLNQESYQLTPLKDKPCGVGEEAICAIQAPVDSRKPQYPDLDATVETSSVKAQMEEAVKSLNGVAKPNKTVTSFRAL